MNRTSDLVGPVVQVGRGFLSVQGILVHRLVQVLQEDPAHPVVLLLLSDRESLEIPADLASRSVPEVPSLLSHQVGLVVQASLQAVNSLLNFTLFFLPEQQLKIHHNCSPLMFL